MSVSNAANEPLKGHLWENQTKSKNIQQNGYLNPYSTLQIVVKSADLPTK
jgi:hypothetical protein